MSAAAGGLAVWTKLRGRSLAELRLRARQGLAAWSERIGISRQIRIPDDRGFTRRAADKVP